MALKTMTPGVESTKGRLLQALKSKNGYFRMQACRHDCNCASQLALPLVAMRHWLCEDLQTATHALPCACAGGVDVKPFAATTLTVNAIAANPREKVKMRDMSISLELQTIPRLSTDWHHA
jgi:hypothetical protein